MFQPPTRKTSVILFDSLENDANIRYGYIWGVPEMEVPQNRAFREKKSQSNGHLHMVVSENRAPPNHPLS